MATEQQREDLRRAIASGDQNAVKRATDAAMSNSSSSSTMGATQAKKDRDRNKNNKTTPAPAAAPAANTTVSQKSNQDYINSTVKGGLAEYIKNQQSRYATADKSLKDKLAQDAARVGYSLSQPARSGNGTPVDQRTLRERYAPKNAEEEKQLKAAEEQMAKTGSAVMPAYARAASDVDWENNLQANRNDFKAKVVDKGPQATKDYYAMQEGQIAKAGSISKALMSGQYSGTTKIDGMTGQEGTFNHQTGQFSGNAKMLDPNYDNRLDASLGNTAKVRDQLFKDSYADYILNGQMEDTPENREWFDSYKKDWDAKNVAGTGYKDGTAPNSTIAAILAAQSQPKTAADPNNDNEIRYLQDLVKQGGGNAEWAKSQLAQLKTSAPGMDPNQRAYLEGLVAKGGGTGEWAKAQLKSAGVIPEAPPSTIDDNQRKYLEGLVAKGGGQGEWAKAQLKAAGIADAANQPPAAAAPVAPAAPAAPTPVNETSPQATQLETQITDIINTSQGDQQKALDEIVKFIEESGVVTPEEIMSFEQARQQSAAALDPKFDEARQDRMNALSADALRRGFYGQKSADAQQFQEMGNLENQRSAEIATLANTLVGQSKEDSYRKATFQQGQVQQKLSNMMSILQAKGALSQQMLANLSMLLDNEHNKKAEALAERQFDLTQANTYKQWGFDDAEAARKAQLFPLELESAKLQISAQKKALASSGQSTAKLDSITPSQIIGIYKSAAERAGEATDRMFPPIEGKNGTKTPNPRAKAYYEQQYVNFTQQEFGAYGLNWQPPAMPTSQQQGQTGTYAPGQ